MLHRTEDFRHARGGLPFQPSFSLVLLSWSQMFGGCRTNYPRPDEGDHILGLVEIHGRLLGFGLEVPKPYQGQATIVNLK